MLNRWGDWRRIEYEDFVYIIHIDKEDNPFEDGDIFIPWFSIHITKKTAKKRKDKNALKYDPRFTIIGKTFNMIIMRQIEEAVRSYLMTWEPKYIIIGAYEIDHERRIKLYLNRLATMGYFLIKHDHGFNYETKKTYDDYYLERRN